MATEGYLKDLGYDLKAVRRIKGLSLSAVAQAAKISPAYLQKLEAGVVRSPSPRVLHRLAGALEVSYAKLMELAGYIMPTSDQTTECARGGLVDQALLVDDLSEEDRRAVAAFIACLKALRKT